MNCNEFKNKISDYLFEDNLPQEIIEHLAHCSDCSAEFEQLHHLVQTLKPKVKVCASENFTNNTIHKFQKIKKENKTMKKRVPFYLKVAVLLLLIATSMFLVFFNTNSPKQLSATPIHQILTQSINEIIKSKSMSIDMRIRTLPNDNFEYIGTQYNNVIHKIKVEFSPKRWSIEKPGRKVMFDGKNQYLDIKNYKYVIKAGPNAGFVDWLHILLTPDKILEKEKQNLDNDQSSYVLEEDENLLYLTVTSKAQGDFTNDYLKNTSVQESDNKRYYIFDKKSHQLRSFQLCIIENKTEQLVMFTRSIQYDVTFKDKEFDVKIFGKKQIKNIEELQPKADGELINKTPKEIAIYFFESCAKNDWKKVEKVFPDFDDSFQKWFGGLEIVDIGEPFQSGTYPGYFVPYTIKLKSGGIKKHNLAVRNDNSEKMWEIDGGI